MTWNFALTTTPARWVGRGSVALRSAIVRSRCVRDTPVLGACAAREQARASGGGNHLSRTPRHPGWSPPAHSWPPAWPGGPPPPPKKKKKRRRRQPTGPETAGGGGGGAGGDGTR